MSNSFESFDDFLDGARHGRRLNNSIGRAPMTRSRLQSLILQGFGQGRGDAYKPWIGVGRANSARESNHQVAVTSCQSAPLHLLSDLEVKASRVASWLGAIEIRTQFPLFPWAGHPHPNSGVNAELDAKLAPTKGLLEIASRAKISHGNWVGAPDLPYVATTDLLVERGDRPSTTLYFWSVKPAALLENHPKRKRMKERIELERLYAESVGGKHVLYDGSKVSEELLANLGWMEPLRVERVSPNRCADRARFVKHFQKSSSREALRDRISRAAASAGISQSEGGAHFRAAAWLTEVDIDLNQPVVMSEPMKTGGSSFKNALFTSLTGEQQ